MKRGGGGPEMRGEMTFMYSVYIFELKIETVIL